VAIPGNVTASVRSDIVDHCVSTADRFAILDCGETLGTGDDPDLALLDPSNATNVLPDNSDFAAFYFPWIQVYDPASKIANPLSDGLQYVPPSGHLAGIYARVDTERGVHKAPANEVVRGALGLKYQLSKAQQDGLNPQGVNAIRELNGNIRVWGARTIGGNSNADLKYINVRRTLLFLRESIDEGTQWIVFEPNTPALWAKITRNISAFLTNVWRSGALFGTTPEQAFYVKCDAETNPPELRELGQVVTEIGVSIVRPAEFVIFRISQFSAPGK
jgi:phage tail sheath protein FI